MTSEVRITATELTSADDSRFKTKVKYFKTTKPIKRPRIVLLQYKLEFALSANSDF